jgi:hypothetical protein
MILVRQEPNIHMNDPGKTRTKYSQIYKKQISDNKYW